MSRRLSAAFAAFEALLVLVLGVAIPLVVLTLVWAVTYGFSVDWSDFARAAVIVWLLGHGVDVVFQLDPATALAAGAPDADVTFPVTIAALGFALITALFGVRSGGRMLDSGHLGIAAASALLVFGAGAGGLALLTQSPQAEATLWQAFVHPPIALGVGIVAGMARDWSARLGAEDRPAAAPRGARQASAKRASRAGAGLGATTVRRLPRPLIRIADAARDARGWVRDTARIDVVPLRARVAAGAVLRTGSASVALVIGASALILSALLVIRFAEVIRLYQAMHTELIGGVALTAAQLALLPNFVVWTASWLVGPGFAIGAGSSVSPLGTALGPVPGIPVFGAIPTENFDFAFAGLVVPLLAGFIAGIGGWITAAPRLGSARWYWPVIIATGGGLVGGALLGLLVWASAGAAGPGRLAEVGPDPLLVGAVAALEFALAAAAGAFVARAARPAAGSGAARSDVTAVQ